MKKLLTNAACFLGGLAVALLIAEGIARFYVAHAEFLEAEMSPMTQIHEIKKAGYLYGLKPGAKGGIFYQINSPGLRGDDISYEKAPGEERILLLGDSVTFGTRVAFEETFGVLLEESLGPGTTVINTGVPGYNTYHEFMFLKEEGMRYEPDIVILGICLNDVDYPLFSYSIRTQKKLGAMPFESYPSLSWINRLRAKSILVRLFCDYLGMRDETLFKFKLSQIFTGLESRAAGHPGPGDLPADRLIHKSCFINLRDYGSVQWEWLRRRVSEIKSFTESRDIRFLAVVFPFHYQLSHFEYDGVQENFARFFREHGIEALDLLPAMRAQNLEEETFFVDPTHLSPRGHALTAAKIAERLKALRWV